MSHIDRRDFVTLLGGAAAWPVAARGQQGLPVVAFVRSSTAKFTHLEAALREGLREAGFVAGQNVAIEYHYADNRTDRLSAVIADLIRRPVAVIVGNTFAALAAKSLTATVPIVFVTGTDPVRDGLAASLNRPGGNVTGVSFLISALGAKRLGLMYQLVPNATTIAALIHRNSPQATEERGDLPPAARAMGLRLLALEIDSDREIEPAFVSAVQSGAGALLIGGGAFLNSHREWLVALAARHALPVSFPVREPVVAGGLMSYGPSQSDAYRQAGSYVAQILKGEKPGELPVMQSTTFEFVLNLKTAKALGLNISPALLALADEVIE
jgi:putative ABC transport system substrate-binding protein